MERIVDGILFEGKFLENAWDVRTWTKNGVMERSARQVVEWREIGPAGPKPDWDDYLAQFIDDPEKLAQRIAEREQDILDKKAASLKKSALRAKTTCRRIIITEGFDELLTLTYRENQTDRDLCKKHFKEWVRRMGRVIKGFRYCASFELQKRGAMHVHIATHKLPEHVLYKGVKIKAWRLGTEVWRSIVGADNGMCHVGGRTRFGTSRRTKMSLAKMASYVSKYITKDYENAPDESNRYSRSNGIIVSKPEVMRFTDCSLRDLIELTFELSPGDILISHRVGRFKDSMWLCTEKPIKKAP